MDKSPTVIKRTPSRLDGETAVLGVVDEEEGGVLESEEVSSLGEG
jgi:hypothetical protein